MKRATTYSYMPEICTYSALWSSQLAVRHGHKILLLRRTNSAVAQLPSCYSSLIEGIWELRLQYGHEVIFVGLFLALFTDGGCTCTSGCSTYIVRASD